MVKKCERCKKPFNRPGNTKFCEECAFLNRHKKCVQCGKIFVAPEGYIGKSMNKCWECEGTDKKKMSNILNEEILNAKKAGMTYGKYQEWKYLQEIRTNKMIKRLNREMD